MPLPPYYIPQPLSRLGQVGLGVVVLGFVIGALQPSGGLLGLAIGLVILGAAIMVIAANRASRSQYEEDN